jgi:hypothetical protein
VAQRLRAVAAELEGEEGIAHLVLDDLVVPPDPRALEGPLTRIANTLRGRAGALVITSTHVLPQRLSLALQLVPNGTLQVPPFTRNNIAAFLVSRGCSSETLVTQWAGLIDLHTQGHAQLVHARVAAVESASFPSPSSKDLMETPPDVIEAQTEARRLLELLNPAAQELVYRLSLTALLMQRKHVISIAAQEPSIPDPGLALDKLIGPWVEAVAEDLYRISPLVRNAGAEIRGNDWAITAHRSIARGLLALRTLSPWDASAILLHGTAGRDWGVLAHLSMGTLTADADTWSALAESAGWFVLMGTGEGVAAPDTNPFYLF